MFANDRFATCFPTPDDKYPLCERYHSYPSQVVFQIADFLRACLCLGPRQCCLAWLGSAGFVLKKPLLHCLQLLASEFLALAPGVARRVGPAQRLFSLGWRGLGVGGGTGQFSLSGIPILDFITLQRHG